MKTTKELKRGTFTWDDELKKLTVETDNGGKIELDKIYSFALMRFIIRIAQKNFLKNPLTNKEESAIVEEDLELEDPRQTKFNF